MKQMLIRYRRVITGLLVLMLFVMYFLLNQEAFAPLRDVRPIILLAVGVCYVGIVITNGLFIKFIIQPFRKHISVRESVRVSLLSSLGNFFATSGAGLGFRAVYLKRKHGLGYTDYMATLYGNYLLIFMINAVFGLVSLMLVSNKSGYQYYGALLFFVVLLSTSFILSVVKLPTLKKTNTTTLADKLTRHLNNMADGWNRIATNKRLLTRLAMLVTVQLALTVLIGWFEMSALKIAIGLPELLLFSVLGSLSIFVSLTPANLGVKEAVYLLTASVIGLSVGEILLIALIDRGILFGTLGVLWLMIGKDKSTNKMRQTHD
jgi:uncharacterized protein (TIRG00374 family)